MLAMGLGAWSKRSDRWEIASGRCRLVPIHCRRTSPLTPHLPLLARLLCWFCLSLLVVLRASGPETLALMSLTASCVQLLLSGSCRVGLSTANESGSAILLHPAPTPPRRLMDFVAATPASSLGRSTTKRLSRPSLEMADIIRYAGQGFLERSHRWINGQHQKVLGLAS
jgi:hypothetical protein